MFFLLSFISILLFCLAGTVADTTLAELLAADGVLREDPAASALGLPLLGELGLGHPVVAGQGLAAGALGGGADLGLVAGLAGDDLVGGELAETKEGQAGGELLLLGVVALAGGGELDRGNLEEAKVRGALGAVADDNELNLGQDEAVAAAVLAHDVVEVGEAAEVLDALDVALDAHAGVEAVKGLGQADDAGGGLAAKHGSGRGGLAAHVGSEDVLRGRAGLLGGGSRGELQGALRGERQSRVELGDVVRAVDLVQSSLGLRVARRGRGLREERCWDRAVEQTLGARERQDGRCVEVVPLADLAHIPPEVLGVGIPERVRDGADQRRGRVGRGQVAHQGGGSNGLRRRGDAGQSWHRGGSGSVLRVHVRVHVAGLGHGRHVGRHLAVGRVAILLQSGTIKIDGRCAMRSNVVLGENDG